MADLPLNQKFKFATELSFTAPFSGLTTPDFIGTLVHIPVVIMIKNQTTTTVLISDSDSTTDGTTMVSRESIIIDCRANHGLASNMGFPIGTSFYATGSAGTGNIKISYLYAD